MTWIQIIALLIAYTAIAWASALAFIRMGAYTQYGSGSSPEDQSSSVLIRAIFWPIGWPALAIQITFGCLFEITMNAIDRHQDQQKKDRT